MVKINLILKGWLEKMVLNGRFYMIISPTYLIVYAQIKELIVYPPNIFNKSN